MDLHRAVQPTQQGFAIRIHLVIHLHRGLRHLLRARDAVEPRLQVGAMARRYRENLLPGKLRRDGLPQQLTLFRDPLAQKRALDLETTIETIRDKYGFNSIQRLIMKEDPLLSSFNPKHDHVIFPESYFKG